MAIRSRVMQDRRNISRIATRVDCFFEFAGENHKAVATDLSLKGAYFSSAFMPPPGSRINLTIQTDHLPRPLILQGKVMRHSFDMFDHSRPARFGVEFNSAPLDLAKLISLLIAKKST